MTQLMKLYGRMSGGTTPSIRSITKNGAPSTCGSGSVHTTRGTGTSGHASRTASMVRAWRPRSYSGNTGTFAGSGAMRATNRCASGAPSTLHDAENSTVSLDIPLVLGASSSVIVGAASAGSTVASHASSERRVVSGSLVEVCGSPMSISTGSSALTGRRPSGRPPDRPACVVDLGREERSAQPLQELAERAPVGIGPAGEGGVEVVEHDVAGAVEQLLARWRDAEPRDATVGAVCGAGHEPQLLERPYVAAGRRLVDLEPTREVGAGDRAVALDHTEGEEPGAADRRADGPDDALVLAHAPRTRRHEHGEVVDREQLGSREGRGSLTTPWCRREPAQPSARVVSMNSSTISKITSRAGRTVFIRPTICPTGNPASSRFCARVIRRPAALNSRPWSGIGSGSGVSSRAHASVHALRS